jgi:hypothetical protein
MSVVSYTAGLGAGVVGVVLEEEAVLSALFSSGVRSLAAMVSEQKTSGAAGVASIMTVSSVG